MVSLPQVPPGTQYNFTSEFSNSHYPWSLEKSGLYCAVQLNHCRETDVFSQLPKNRSFLRLINKSVGLYTLKRHLVGYNLFSYPLQNLVLRAKIRAAGLSYVIYQVPKKTDCQVGILCSFVAVVTCEEDNCEC